MTAAVTWVVELGDDGGSASMEVRHDGSEEKDGNDLVSVGEGELAVSSNYGLKSVHGCWEEPRVLAGSVGTKGAALPVLSSRDANGWSIHGCWVRNSGL
ncbi:hypothetical protein V6N13_048582 [Hibiscus sabdariffa]|uniref:Uncharacterized protein n=1 Tax=Hibiscus sabdariffa TaxID=183260 RepID=A0ABR2F7M1_9ROSI